MQINQTSTGTSNQKLKRQNAKNIMRMNNTRQGGQKFDEARQPNPSQTNTKGKPKPETKEKQTQTRRKTGHTSICQANSRRKPMNQMNKRSRGESRRSASYLIMSNARGTLTLRRLGDATSVPIARTSTEPRIKKWPPAAAAVSSSFSRRSPITLLSLGRSSSSQHKEQIRCRKPAGNSDGKL